ncbi:hypothetical protein [Glycomyces buryatensis]|uniref:Uncharacterized protein n=1 Tax=Glycomyces buryatensis TaxID=2570927 RepID=A0A4S8Q3E8_9ACTN|nr:hypothetical protein [Glycomyces buryatensis]THV37072.1 hypothetical protein FAB82_21225 [Glycomyces buryatensis]
MAARKPLLPDTPGLAVVSAVLALAVAVVVFIASMPGEERVLMYEGSEVSPSTTCERVNADGETVRAACVEVGTYEERETGWGVPGVVAAVVLAGLAAVVLCALPAQIRERRRREAQAREFATDDDDRQGR